MKNAPTTPSALTPRSSKAQGTALDNQAAKNRYVFSYSSRKAMCTVPVEVDSYDDAVRIAVEILRQHGVSDPRQQIEKGLFAVSYSPLA